MLTTFDALTRRQFLRTSFSIAALSSITLNDALAAGGITQAAPLLISPLAQRCAKAYSQAALNVLPEQSKAVMQESQRGIASGLNQLRGTEKTTLQKELLRFDTLLTAAPQKKILLAVSHQSNVLQCTPQQSTETKPSDLSELAMLSQRMAKNFFLKASGIEHAAVNSELLNDQRSFSGKLLHAQSDARLPIGVKRNLQLAQDQWVFYGAALKSPPLATSQQHVALSSERLWKLLTNTKV